jgi:tetratricopeptide (TPR) repeat protein
LIELQFIIFCQKDNSFESNTDELLQNTRIIFDDLPLTIIHKKWEIVLDYLCFEYYYSIGSNKAAGQYFEKVNSQLSNFLLYNHIGLVAKFLNSKIKFCSEFDRCEDLSIILKSDKLFYDTYDTYTLISLGMYNAMSYFNQKNYKKAIDGLFELQNEFVFKDYFYEFLNIKLTLAYFYIIIGEFDKAQACLKILARRLKTEDMDGYSHVPYLLKAFDIEINKEKTPKSIIKKRDLLILFLASNTKKNNFEVLTHLIPELKERYQI